MNKSKKQAYDKTYKKLNADRVKANNKDFQQKMREVNKELYKNLEYMSTATKTCKKCLNTMSVSDFFKDQTVKGGFKAVCKKCMAPEVKERNSKRPKKQRVIKSKYSSEEERKEEINKRGRSIYYRDIDKNKLRKSEYYKKNKEFVIKATSAYKNKKRSSDNLYKLAENIRSRVSNSLKRSGFAKNGRTEAILGCSFNEFKLYIESLFESWMTWCNYGLWNGDVNFGWDLDHIIPLSSAITQDDVIKLNHYSNIRPLCSHENRYVKRGKL